MYEGLKKYWAREQGSETTPIQGAICGSMSGSVAAALTCPLDVVKTRMMLGSKSASGELYQGTLSSLRTIVFEEGPAALFKGIGPRVGWISVRLQKVRIHWSDVLCRLHGQLGPPMSASWPNANHCGILSGTGARVHAPLTVILHSMPTMSGRAMWLEAPGQALSSTAILVPPGSHGWGRGGDAAIHMYRT
eukprot:scaffold302848_cov35-Tisochrysis_lutea.AAC.4